MNKIRAVCLHGHRLDSRLDKKNLRPRKCRECLRINQARYDKKKRDHPEQINRIKGKFVLRHSLARINHAIKRELYLYNRYGKYDRDYIAIGKWLEQRGKQWNQIHEWREVQIQEACST